MHWLAALLWAAGRQEVRRPGHGQDRGGQGVVETGCSARGSWEQRVS